MSKYRIETEDGRTFEIETEDSVPKTEQAMKMPLPARDPRAAFGDAFIGSAMETGRNIGNALANPRQTAKSVMNLVGQAGNKANSLIGLGDNRPSPELDALTDSMKKRYGSLPAIADTLTSDPVGAGLDIYGAASGLSGLARGVVRDAPEIAARVGDVGTAVRRGVAKPIAAVPPRVATTMGEAAGGLAGWTTGKYVGGYPGGVGGAMIGRSVGRRMANNLQKGARAIVDEPQTRMAALEKRTAPLPPGRPGMAEPIPAGPVPAEGAAMPQGTPPMAWSDADIIEQHPGMSPRNIPGPSMPPAGLAPSFHEAAPPSGEPLNFGRGVGPQLVPPQMPRNGLAQAAPPPPSVAQQLADEVVPPPPPKPEIPREAYEAVGRAGKVPKLAQVLEQAGAPVDDLMLTVGDDAFWGQVAKKAGVPMPSQTTRHQVLAQMKLGKKNPPTPPSGPPNGPIQ